MALLALAYALPLGGLALFLLMTGLNTRIARMERERVGVRYIQQLLEAHNAVERVIWNGDSTPGRSELAAVLARLDALEKALAPRLSPLAAPHAGQRETDLVTAQLQTVWDEARSDPAEAQDLARLLGQLQALLAHTSDAAGLTFSPDAETGYVTDIVAFALPVHLERLLQMHEQLARLAAAPTDSTQDAVAGIFSRQLAQEEPRLERSIRLAVDGDARSAHVSAAFQKEFPPAGAAFLRSLHTLTAALAPARPAGGGPADWETLFRTAYGEAARFWRFSAAQLDILLAGQVAHAERERNTAIVIAAAILVTLLPLTWLYYRAYMRPIVQDLISEVREASEAALRSKNQFLAMMSHEIRTPMNGVIGFAHLLADTKLDEQQREFVHTINASGESLLTIINDILDYSKLEADRVELETSPVVVRDLIDDVLGLLSPLAHAKQLELIAWVEPDVPAVVPADPTRLQQVLLNLAGNAVKFTAAGHVELGLERAPEPGRLRFHVRDTGMGIPADRLDRLFKAFSQVDSSITRTHGGTGLGLAISQRLVAAMGGTIGVQSEPGKGTEFHFTLPLPADEAVPVASTEEIDQLLSGKSILVVDDAEASRRLFERMLGRHGAVVTAIDSAAAARAALAARKFDLGILDYMMPGTDGVTLAREIAGQFPAGRLILASSAPGAGLEPGLFSAVVLKPVRNLAFLCTLRRVLRGEAPAREAVPAPAVQAPPFARDHPLRILAVDDNPVNLKVISAMLTALGYAPAVTDSAVKALVKLRAEPFDFVLMDVQMPELDGHEATRRLRAGEAGELNRRTRVIALTAGTMREEREACRIAGMDDFLAKPIARPLLQEKLMAASAAAS